MSLYIQDGILLPPFLKEELLSAIFSAIAYGFVIVLSGNCFHLLLRKRDIYANRMRITLPIYVIVMLLSSTWKLIGTIYMVMNDLSSKDTSLFLYHSFGVPMPVIIWGADGFMVWRCLVLYQHVARGLKVGIIVLLSLLSFASFVFGVAMLVATCLTNRPDRLVTYDTNPGFLEYAYIAFFSLSTLVNIILAVLIVSRLVYHRRYIRNTLGVGHGSPYTNIITMCVESSALMVIATVLYTILSFVSRRGIGLMYDITAHIGVISPLLIVYRVAIGRAVPPTLLSLEQVVAQIWVNIPVSNPSDQEGEV